MPKWLIHFIRSRKPCNGFCLTCKHYKTCKEELENE